ncbi:dihydroxyacetone kinase [Arthrobacter livingstonensis]|uniref:Phosphocarrier protein HPr n=1 Tax=Arthrobacter livingstonensis TaxID=670078 RepID=A0A2V5LFH7_9MICC|nr:dihydroxyacetone kinase phosphoryl donor subunit DhaM [Arthrobacter livingstonensis]PYI65100.1 dihydroxyacetone kinase [Arthrobacter livingstonensis]
MTVGLVIVSHSAQLAAGVVELAAQMARDVVLAPAGGTDDGGIGTSLEKVMSAMGLADTGDGVVVLTDLGSAVMTAESALEFMGSPENMVLADAPLVEGAVAAAVAAQSGATLAVVQKAAETALDPGAAASAKAPGAAQAPGGSQAPCGGQPSDGGPAADKGAGAGHSTGAAVTAVLTLINPMGLHARPAAVLAGELGAMDVDIEINGADGQSVFLLMALGAGEGRELHVSASGPDAQRAVDLVRSKVEEGFGEL